MRPHLALALPFALLANGCTLSLWRHNGFHPPPQNHPTAIANAALDADARLWLQLDYRCPWPANAVVQLGDARWAIAQATRAPLPPTVVPVHACAPGELDRMLRENQDPAAHTLPPALWLTLEPVANDRAIVWVLDSRAQLRGQRITLPHAGPDWLAPATALHILATPVTVAIDVAALPLYLVLAIPYLAGIRGH